MAKKENKGGELTPGQIEKDNRAKGKTNEPGHLQGSQDTGDKGVRPFDSAVQGQDATTDEIIPEE